MLQASGEDDSPNAELAAAERSADESASRGGRRGPSEQANAIASAAAQGQFGSPSDVADATTTTTSTTSTTTSSTTTPPAPKPAAVAAPQKSKAVVAPKPAPAPAPAKSTARAAEVAAPAPAKADGKDTGIVGDDVWSRLARCESGNKNHSSGPFYGYFQFLPSTWRSVGGSGLPSDHTYLEQKELAMKLQARSGWGQWPVCSKKAGAA